MTSSSSYKLEIFNKKDADEKLNKCDYEFDKIKTLIKPMMVQNQHSSPYNID